MIAPLLKDSMWLDVDCVFQVSHEHGVSHHNIKIWLWESERDTIECSEWKIAICM